MKYLDKQLIYVNSRNRVSGSAEDFTFRVQMKAGNKFNSVALLQATISKSYYLIQSPYNYFTVTETSGGVDRTFTVSLSEGNDYVQAFASDVQTKCIAASLASGYGWTYAVSAPNPTSNSTVDPGKLVFTATQGSSISAISGVSFIFPTFTLSTVYEPMGFDYSSTNAFTVAAGTGTLTSTNVVYFQAQDVIFVRTDMCNHYTGIDGAAGNCLQEVTVNSGFAAYSNINFQQYDAEMNSREFISHGNGEFRFFLTDENGSAINLNGGVVQLLIVVYQRNETAKVVNLFTKAMSAMVDEFYPKVRSLIDWAFDYVNNNQPTIR